MSCAMRMGGYFNIISVQTFCLIGSSTLLKMEDDLPYHLELKHPFERSFTIQGSTYERVTRGADRSVLLLLF